MRTRKITQNSFGRPQAPDDDTLVAVQLVQKDAQFHRSEGLPLALNELVKIPHASSRTVALNLAPNGNRKVTDTEK